LLQGHRLPLTVAKAGKIAVVGPVEELAAFVWALSAKKVTLVIPVEVNLEGLPRRAIALQELVPIVAVRTSRPNRMLRASP
jgi:hypothetical protein